MKHNEWEFPDLIILDGGELQIKSVLPLLKDLNIPVIGRDKSGNHSKSAAVKLLIPDLEAGNFKQIILPDGSHIARLIARIDEEAHRFAISYHTYLKRKNMLS